MIVLLDSDYEISFFKKNDLNHFIGIKSFPESIRLILGKNSILEIRTLFQ